METSKQIKEIAKKLKLPILADYKNYLKSGIKLEEGLLILLQEQLEDKKLKSIERKIKNAKFPMLKTLDTFIFDNKRLPNLKEEQVRELAKSNYIEEKQNVIAIGNCGTGKSHLATALGLEAIEKGYNVYFRTASELVNQMSEAQEEKQLIKYLKKINKCQLLIVDELGYLSFDHKGASLLFQVLAERNEAKSTFITTNLKFSEWVDFLGDPMIASAIIDRMAYKTIFLDMNGESFRLQNADKHM